MVRSFFALLVGVSAAFSVGCGGVSTESAGPGVTPEEQKTFEEDYEKQMEEQMKQQGGGGAPAGGGANKAD